MRSVTSLAASSLLFVSMSANAVLIDFESLSAGTIVTNQFAEATFSGSSNIVLAQARPLGNFICGTNSCIENTFVVTPQGGRPLTGKSRGLLEVY